MADSNRRRCESCRHVLRRAARPDARFCSARCRAAAWRTVRRQAQIAAAEVDHELRWQNEARIRRGGGTPPRDTGQHCAFCGNLLWPVYRFGGRAGGGIEAKAVHRTDRLYCDGRCRTRAWRARKAFAEAVTAWVAGDDQPNGSLGQR